MRAVLPETDLARIRLAVEFLKDSKEVLEKAKAKPTLIIFDLNFDGIQPLKLIGKLKGNSDYKGISLIGYLSHVQGELKQQAQEAGADMVMAHGGPAARRHPRTHRHRDGGRAPVESRCPRSRATAARTG